MATLQNALGSNTADVNAQSELAVALSKLPANAGYAALLGEAHDGAAGLPALRRPVHVSPEKRLGVGIDSVLWDDVFNHATLNLRKYRNESGAGTIALAGGAMTLNSGASTTSGFAAQLRTYRTFPAVGNFPLTLDFWFSLALVPQAQNNIEIGIGVPAGAVASPATDGIYMSVDTAGALQLVCNYNGTTTTSGAIVLPTGLAWTANRFYHCEIVLHADRAELYFDAILIGAVARSAANSAGAMSQNQTGFLFARLHNAAATGAAQKLNIARWCVTLGDGNFSRDWGSARTGLGDGLVSTPDGASGVMLDNFANSAAPASATLSNTAAGYTKLGGQFQFAAVAGSETDYALFAYQMPFNTAILPGKTMVVTGIDIDSFNMGAANSATPTLLEWHVGIGSGAVSLATADTSTTRSPHRKFLGDTVYRRGAAIGARADRVDQGRLRVAHR